MVCVSSSFYYALLARNTVFLLLNFFGVQAFCLSSQQQVNVIAQCFKITLNVAFEYLILALSIDFCSINIGLSGNTVRMVASVCQNMPN